MPCKCCEVYKKQVEYQQKWIDRLMEELSPAPDPKDDTVIPSIDEADDPLKETVVLGEG